LCERERKKEENNRKPIGKKKESNTNCRIPYQNHFIYLPCSHLILGVKGKLVPAGHIRIDVFLFAFMSLSAIFPSYPLVRILIPLIHPGCSRGALAASWAPSSRGDLQRAADSHSTPTHAFSVGVTSAPQRLFRTFTWRL